MHQAGIRRLAEPTSLGKSQIPIKNDFNHEEHEVHEGAADIDAAVAQFGPAVQLEPTFGGGYIGLANAKFWKYELTGSRFQPDSAAGRGHPGCRTRPTVSTMAFARNHAGRAGGIPARIAIDSGDYDRQRGYEVAAGYARAGGLLTSWADTCEMPRRSMKLTISGLALIAVGLVRGAVVAQNNDARLDVINAAPRLDLQRSEFILQPPLVATSPTVDRAVSSVAVDRRGYVYVIQRGVPKPIVVADSVGKVVASWGEGLFKIPHTIRVDPEGNVWSVDAESSMVYKFTPQGRQLRTISVGGQPAVAPPRRNPPGTGPPLIGQFWGTTDVAFGNSHVYVSDGYANNRILEYDADGRKLREWGARGTGPGQFDLPHAIAVAPNGNLYIADRENGRIQWFTKEGRYLGKWDYGGRLYSLVFGTNNDVYFTARSKQAPVDADGWLVRVDAKTGRVLGRIESPVHVLSSRADGSLFIGTNTGKVLIFKFPK